MAAKDNWLKVAARCCDCGAIYSAWKRPDESIHCIGRTDGCRCGASEFRVISKTDDDSTADGTSASE